MLGIDSLLLQDIDNGLKNTAEAVNLLSQRLQDVSHQVDKVTDAIGASANMATRQAEYSSMEQSYFLKEQTRQQWVMIILSCAIFCSTFFGVFTTYQLMKRSDEFQNSSTAAASVQALSAREAVAIHQ